MLNAAQVYGTDSGPSAPYIPGTGSHRVAWSRCVQAAVECANAAQGHLEACES